MEKVLAWVLLAYAVALLVGERLRDALFGGPEAPGPADASTRRENRRRRRSKWRRYSGAFALLKGYWPISAAVRAAAVKQALTAFAALVLPPVPTLV